MFFCLRRFTLVLFFVMFSEQVIVLIFAILVLSTLTVSYVINSYPHVDPLHNDLEIFNEMLIIMLTYSMFGFIEESLLTRSQQWVLGLYASALIISILAVNFFVILRQAFIQAKLMLKKYTNKKA